MEGFLLVHKPAGPSSFTMINAARKALHTRKFGHTGTLDPFAEGLLILAAGKYTRLIPLFDDTIKEYIAEGVLGETRDTEDSTGEKTGDFPYNHITEQMVREIIINQFTGTLKQRPPSYSALKVSGKRSYELARAGHDVQHAEREYTIHEIGLIRWSPPLFTVRVLCSSGTYVRSIIRDIGTALGSGAYTDKLLRTKIGVYSLNDAVAPEHITPEALIPFAQMFPDVQTTLITDEMFIEKLSNGNINLHELHDGLYHFVDRSGSLIAKVEKNGGVRYLYARGHME